VLILVIHIVTIVSKKGYCIHIDVLLVEVKGKAVPVQVLRVPGIRHMKVLGEVVSPTKYRWYPFLPGAE
jgi:hypothetical protein